jgi:hypothetical protein
MRCYAVRIYENDSLVHLFVPYSGTDGVGLVDLLTGDKAFKHAASTGADPVYVAGPLAVSAEEIATVGTAEIADFSLSKDKMRTVTASAAGAAEYRWTRNGVVVGESEGSLGIGWRRQPTPDVFTVTPIYRLGGGSESTGESKTFNVSYLPVGMTIVIR